MLKNNKEQTMENKGRTALITGANRGLGFAMAEKLGSMGMKIIMACRQKASGEKAVEALKAKNIDAELCVVDVGDVAQIEAAGKEIAAKHPVIDVLINNAGISIEPYEMKIEEMDYKLHDKTMSVNVTGTIWMIKVLTPLLKKSPDARVINFSSGLGQLSVPRMGKFLSYSVSKTAVNQVTWYLADEFKDTNIKIFSVDPGWVKTDMGGPNAMLEIPEGIDTPVWLATAEKEEVQSGGFYKERKILGW